MEERMEGRDEAGREDKRDCRDSKGDLVLLEAKIGRSIISFTLLSNRDLAYQGDEGPPQPLSGRS
jgi:hypothetical protein